MSKKNDNICKQTVQLKLKLIIAFLVN